MTHKLITDKQSAMSKRQDRKIGLENKVRQYTQTIEELRLQAISDAKVLDRLVELETELEERKAEMMRMQALVAGASIGEEFDEAMSRFLEAKSAIEATETQMKLAYYGK